MVFIALIINIIRYVCSSFIGNHNLYLTGISEIVNIFYIVLAIYGLGKIKDCSGYFEKTRKLYVIEMVGWSFLALLLEFKLASINHLENVPQSDKTELTIFLIISLVYEIIMQFLIQRGLLFGSSEYAEKLGAIETQAKNQELYKKLLSVSIGLAVSISGLIGMFLLSSFVTSLFKIVVILALFAFLIGVIGLDIAWTIISCLMIVRWYKNYKIIKELSN